MKDRSEILQYKQQLIKILDISELQYSEYLELFGYQYLCEKYPNDIDEFKVSKLFWIWWLIVCNEKDKEFIQKYEYKLIPHHPEKALKQWILIHKNLDIHIPDFILLHNMPKLKNYA